MKEERKKVNPQPVTSLPAQPRGRHPLLLDLDVKLITFLQAIRRRGGIINIHVVRATADALIKCNPAFAQQLSKFEMPRSWVQSLYRRMNFTRRIGTTGRPPVPKGVYDECRFEFLNDVDHKMKLNSIPPELVFNADQTPSSYVSVRRLTMATHGSKTVPIVGLSDKRNNNINLCCDSRQRFLTTAYILCWKNQTKSATWICISERIFYKPKPTTLVE